MSRVSEGSSKQLLARFYFAVKEFSYPAPVKATPLLMKDDVVHVRTFITAFVVVFEHGTGNPPELRKSRFTKLRESLKDVQKLL